MKNVASIIHKREVRARRSPSATEEGRKQFGESAAPWHLRQVAEGLAFAPTPARLNAEANAEPRRLTKKKAKAEIRRAEEEAKAQNKPVRKRTTKTTRRAAIKKAK